MTYLCLKCYNEIHGTNYKPEEVWLKYRPPCARCGEWTLIVYDTKPSPFFLEAQRLGKELAEKKAREEVTRVAEEEENNFEEEFEFH